MGSQRIYTQRFSSFNSTHSALQFHHDLEPQGSFFKPTTGVKIHVRDEKCESLLNSFQYYPLKKMQEVGYLTQKQALEYSNLAHDLFPSQITLFTKVDPSKESVRSNDKTSYEQESWSNSLFGDHPILASMYSVSNFAYDANRRVMLHTKLPIEMEPQWAPVFKGHLSDRQRYMTWEIGRAAQEGVKEIDDLIRASILGILHDANAIAFTMGASPEEIFDIVTIVFHSKSEAHQRAYKVRHPHAKVIHHPILENEALFVVSLREMIQIYQPQKISKIYSDLIQSSNSKLKLSQAVTALSYLKAFRWNEVDLGWMGLKSPSHQPIVFSPASSGTLFMTRIVKLLLNEFGVPLERIDSVVDVFSRYQYDLLMYAPKKYQDLTEESVTAIDYRKHKAFEISNLDPKLALEDTTYIKSVLTGIYRFWMLFLSGHLSNDYPIEKKMILEISKMFDERGIKFGITTLNPKVSKAIESLKPIASSQRFLPGQGFQQSRFKSDDPVLSFINRGINQTYFMHFFSIDQIHQMGNEIKNQAKEANQPFYPPTALNSKGQLEWFLSTPHFF